MTDLLILGTDTDAGKTTFAVLWLAAFGDSYAYWKPVESGPSDSERVRELVPGVAIHPPLCRLREPVAPPLAARLEGKSVPTAAAILAARPRDKNRRLLIETFGSPFSPLNEDELQIELIRALGIPCVLVSSSALGAIGRTLQGLLALKAEGVQPAAVVLIGLRDDFALQKLKEVQDVPVFHLEPPARWDSAGVQAAQREQRAILDSIYRSIVGQTFLSAQEPGRQECLPHDLLARDRKAIWHPYTSLRDPEPPLVCVGAQGEFLDLADGRRVIDGISSWWTILHGHRFPPLMKALEEAARTWDHVHFAGVTHAPAVELAELLLGTAPWSGGRVFYSDNGSTAVEVALKMAYQFWCHQGEPQRTVFIGFEGGYHGDTFGAMGVGRDPVFFGTYEPLLFRAERLPLSAVRLDECLRRLHGQVAAVILEPLVQGAGGMLMHSPATLRELFDVAKSRDVLFIADEVMTGGGRTGTLWAYQAAEIAPDLICAAKTLAGGVLPLAATLVAPHVAAAWDSSDRRRTFFHGHSFTAHPLACAVAVANWRLLTVSPPTAPARFEAFWNETLALLRDDPRVREVRNRGIIAAIEVAAPGGYLADVGTHLRRVCLEHGVLLRPLGNVLYALPPFCTSQASLARVAEAMIKATTAPVP